MRASRSHHACRLLVEKLEPMYAAEAKERQLEALQRGNATKAGRISIPQKIEESKKEAVARQASEKAARAAKTIGADGSRIDVSIKW
jgi:hypothetical protein